MGVYTREDGPTFNKRPVWKSAGKINTTYFYYDSEGYWRMSKDYKADSGWIQSVGDIKSEDSGLSSIPKTGWTSYLNDVWKRISYVTVVGK